MTDIRTRLVTLTGPEEALPRFRGMGAQPVLDGLLVRYWARLVHQIGTGNGVKAESTANEGQVTIETAVQELVAAYHWFAPHYLNEVNVAVVFPPLIAAVFPDSNDSNAVIDAARARLQS